MRKFTEIQHELGLKKFLASPLGTLYFVPFAPGFPRVMVRHFDNELTSTLVKPFAELVQASQNWLERRPELARLVKVEQPIEVGHDFIARPYHMYYTSTDAYVDWEDPPEPPEELEKMRSALRAEIGQSDDPRDAIIEAVLARSLLKPTGKTYFGDDDQFIVVEPKVTREDLECWSALQSSS